jgi:hypothetical protein
LALSIGSCLGAVALGALSMHSPARRTDVGIVTVPPRGWHAAPTATTDAASPRTLVVSTASPLRVLEIGDSLGIDLGDQLEAQLDATGVVRTVMASVGDSGLCNDAYFDWPVHLAALLATDHPQVVVVFLGANDDQGLYVDDVAAPPGGPAWVAGYTQRVDAMLGEIGRAGAQVVWVGMPPMANPDLDAAMQVENTIYQRQTDAVGGGLYLASAPVLGTAAGLYRSSAADGAGAPVALRTPDGVHLTPAGASLLARWVIGAVETHWHLTFHPTATTGTTTVR